MLNKKASMKQWVVTLAVSSVIGAGCYFCGMLTVSKSTKAAKNEKTTQVEISPTEKDIHSYQAQYNERLTTLENSHKKADQEKALLKKEIRALQQKLERAEAEIKQQGTLNTKKTELSSGDGWPPGEVLGKGASSKANPTASLKTGLNAPQRSRYSQANTADARQSSPAPRLTIGGAVAQKTAMTFGEIKKEEKPAALTYLPSGTFAKARLLNGAIAPTRGQGSGNPVPILLELTDSAVLPNLYRSGIKRCFVTATATGELASERVLARLDRLSCIDEEGGAVDTKIQGYVSGEDGKTGLRARLVTKSGQAIANALFTGTLSGFGKAISLAAEDQTTSITGTVTTSVKNPWRAGFGEGASHAMDRITDYYLKLASDMFPVLEVDSGRSVEIVISQGLSIERLNNKKTDKKTESTGKK